MSSLSPPHTISISPQVLWTLVRSSIPKSDGFVYIHKVYTVVKTNMHVVIRANIEVGTGPKIS